MSHFRDSHPKLTSGNLDREAKRRSLIQRKSKDKNEDAEDSPVTPDSTTEPPRPAHDLQEGEDVFYCTEEGQNMLGTIGQVTQFRCQILFGDGTQQWAPFQRVKKLSCSFNEEGPSPPSRSADESTPSRTSTRDQLKTDIVCTVCKNVKKMSSKKARLFTNLPFKCNRCIGTKTESNPTMNITNNNHHHITPAATLQKKASLSRQLIKRLSTSDSPCPPKNQQLKSTTSSSNSLNHLAMNLQTGDISIRPILNINSSSSPSTSQYLPTQQTTSSIPHHQHSPKTSVPHHHHHDRSASVNSPPVMSRGASTMTLQNSNHMTPQGRIGQGTGSMSMQMSSAGKNTRTNLCFHCNKRTCLYDRVHCNMCERYCHLLCLSVKPPPLEGDKFWDVMCAACGTQNEKGGSKVFSVRRSISSWSDVVHLIINCLKVINMGQQYFDFDNQIMIFFDNNIDKLHLPRQYKVVPREERKTHLLDALTKSRFRFSKHKTTEMKKTGSSWALRSDHPSSPTSPCPRPTSDYQDANPNTTTTTTLNKNGNIHVTTTDKDIALSRSMNQLRSPANNNSTTNNNNKNVQGLPTRFADIDSSSRPSYLNLNQSPSQSSNSDQSTLPLSFNHEKVDNSPHSTLSVKFKNSSYSSHKSSISTSPTLSSPSHSKSASASPRITTTTTPTINNCPSINNNQVATSFPRVLSKEVLLRNPITTNIILSPTNATIQSQRIQGKGSSEVKKDRLLHRTSKITHTPTKKVGRPRKRDNADKFKTKPSAKSAKSSLSDTSVNVHRQRLRIRLPVKRPGDKQKDVSDATAVTTDSPKKKQMCSTPSSTSSSSNVVKTSQISLSLASSPMQQEQHNLTSVASSSSPSKEIRSRKRVFASDTINSSQNQNSPTPGMQLVDGTIRNNVGGMGKTINQLNGMSKTGTLGGSKSNRQNHNVGKSRKFFSNQMSHNNSNIDSVTENENKLDGSNEDLSTFRSNLLDACLYGGLKTQCLPHIPKSKTEMEKKIGEYLTAEAEDNCRSSSPSHNEIGYDGFGGGGCGSSSSSSIKRLFCNWPSRHNYPPTNYDGYGDNSNNMDFGKDKLVDGGDSNFLQQGNVGKKSKRNLEDLDSYEIIAMRVGEDGIVRYEVLWLDEVAFTSSEEEDMDLDSKDDVHTQIDEVQSSQQMEELKTSMEVDDETIMNGKAVGNEGDKGFVGIELQDSSNCAEISIKKENEGASEAAAKKNGHRKLSVSLSIQQQQTSKRDPLFIDLTDSP